MVHGPLVCAAAMNGIGGEHVFVPDQNDAAVDLRGSRGEVRLGAATDIDEFGNHTAGRRRR